MKPLFAAIALLLAALATPAFAATTPTIGQILEICPDDPAAQACPGAAEDFLVPRPPSRAHDQEIIDLVIALAEDLRAHDYPIEVCLDTAEGMEVLADGMLSSRRAEDIRDIALTLCDGVETGAIRKRGIDANDWNHPSKKRSGKRCQSDEQRENGRCVPDDGGGQPTFCELHPQAPECSEEPNCEVDPNAAGCGPPPVNCDETPDHPSCDPPPVNCDETPDHPSCDPPPVNCDETPDHPSCDPPPLDCTGNNQGSLGCPPPGGSGNCDAGLYQGPNGTCISVPDGYKLCPNNKLRFDTADCDAGGGNSGGCDPDNPVFGEDCPVSAPQQSLPTCTANATAVFAGDSPNCQLPSATTPPRENACNGFGYITYGYASGPLCVAAYRAANP